jgi:hypothetical protein
MVSRKSDTCSLTLNKNQKEKLKSIPPKIKHPNQVVRKKYQRTPEEYLRARNEVAA